jgi:hypothetical protein
MRSWSSHSRITLRPLEDRKQYTRHLFGNGITRALCSELDIDITRTLWSLSESGPQTLIQPVICGRRGAGSPKRIGIRHPDLPPEDTLARLPRYGNTIFDRMQSMPGEQFAKLKNGRFRIRLLNVRRRTRRTVEFRGFLPINTLGSSIRVVPGLSLIRKRSAPPRTFSSHSRNSLHPQTRISAD